VLARSRRLADTHVRDEESAARVAVPRPPRRPVDSTFRPQEALSTQALAAAVRAVDRVQPQAVFVTGDIVDSAQANEFAQARAVLDGGRVDPDSGAPAIRASRRRAIPTASSTGRTWIAPRHPGSWPPPSGRSARPASTRRGTRRWVTMTF
jgi:3',5'-cyclic AMP phosphodiesterase CpdA